MIRKFISNNKWLTGILIASIILRVAAALYLGNEVVNLPGTYDQISYNTLAIRVLNNHGFTFGETWWPITPAGAPTAHWSFLYTLYLVVVYSIFGVNPLVARVIQAIITGLLQPYLAYKIGSYLFSKTIGIASAGLTAIYIYFIYYSGTLMTEPFFITLVMGSLYLALQLGRYLSEAREKISFKGTLKWSILLGLTLGGAVLLRQLFLFFVPVLFLWLVWIKRKENLRLPLLSILVSSGIIVLMILPFTFYNISRFGHFVLLNTNSGYAFFWANHPIYGTHFQAILPPEMGTYQSLIPVELRNLDEAALDQALLKRGIQFITDNPIRYVLLSISRIPVYFMFWPSKDSGLISNISRVASFGVLWPFMLYGLLRSVSTRKRYLMDLHNSSLFLIILFVTIYTLIHLLSWALIRYRLPVDAVLLVFAALALVDLAQRVKSLRKVSTQAV